MNTVAGLVLSAASTYTIAAGTASITDAKQTFAKIAVQSGTIDNLFTLTMTGVAAGQILVIQADDEAKTIVCKHGTGNLYLSGAADFSLDSVKNKLMLISDGTDWHQIAGSSNIAPPEEEGGP